MSNVFGRPGGVPAIRSRAPICDSHSAPRSLTRSHDLRGSVPIAAPRRAELEVHPSRLNPRQNRQCPSLPRSSWERPNRRSAACRAGGPPEPVQSAQNRRPLLPRSSWERPSRRSAACISGNPPEPVQSALKPLPLAPTTFGGSAPIAAPRRAALVVRPSRSNPRKTVNGPASHTHRLSTPPFRPLPSLIGQNLLPQAD
jgi:hypothetical protein